MGSAGEVESVRVCGGRCLCSRGTCGYISSLYYRVEGVILGFMGLLLFFLVGVFFSSRGGRVGHVDARPCVTRVHIVRFPASALRCVVPGPLGDASGSVSAVVASVHVCVIFVVLFMRLSLCGADVKKITGCIRVVCE